MTRQVDDCFARNTADKALLPLDQALAWLESAVTPVAETEEVSLVQGLGRVLARDVVASLALPPFASSSVDGWAVSSADLPVGQAPRLPVGGRIAAGHPLTGTIRPGAAYRIFTGAPVPAGLDLVAMQEHCQAHPDDTVTLPSGLRAGVNVRPAGEAMARGEVAIAAGTRLAPQHLGLAASLGLVGLCVFRRLRVALFSTGDELCLPGTPLREGAIYDANRVTLNGLLSDCDVTDLGMAPDRADTVKALLAEAAKDHDLIITSGGVSVGEEDHVKAALTSLGRLHLWRLALKPGKPLALGQIGNALFLGLPGNPVSVAVTFFLVGRPLIAALAGADYHPPRRFPLPAAFSLNKPAGRREFPRARLIDSPFGLAVELYRSDSSGILASLTATEGLVDLPEEGQIINPGDMVSFLPFSELWP